MITTDYARFEIGDVVRVRAARRRDVTFTVSEVLDDGRVRAVNDRGEALYASHAFELVDDPQPVPEATQRLTPLEPWRQLVPVPRELDAEPIPAPDGRAPEEIARIFDRANVRARPGESIESLLRRFKRAMDKSGVLRECRERQRGFIPKPVKRREKSRRARARRAKGD